MIFGNVSKFTDNDQRTVSDLFPEYLLMAPAGPKNWLLPAEGYAMRRADRFPGMPFKIYPSKSFPNPDEPHDIITSGLLFPVPGLQIIS